MTIQSILETYDFIEKEDLQVWPDSCIEGLDKDNVDKILAFLSDGAISGEELLVLDLPAFLYPVEKFKALWTALVKEQGKRFAEDVREEELTPSDEFERLEKEMK